MALSVAAPDATEFDKSFEIQKDDILAVLIDIAAVFQLALGAVQPASAMERAGGGRVAVRLTADGSAQGPGLVDIKPMDINRSRLLSEPTGRSAV